jgi:hypothetical protein
LLTHLSALQVICYALATGIVVAAILAVTVITADQRYTEDYELRELNYEYARLLESEER